MPRNIRGKVDVLNRPQHSFNMEIECFLRCKGKEKHLMMWLLGVFEEPLNVFQMNLLAFPIKIIIFAAK